MPSCKIIYIGLRGDKLERDLQERFKSFDEIRFITSGKFRRYFGQSIFASLADFKTIILNIRDFFKVVIGIFQAKRILSRMKPDVVFSKGGFVVVPVGIAARIQKVPIITHDSDIVPGLANRIVGRWAKVHATGMPAKYYNYPKSSIQYVGVPIDERITPAASQSSDTYKRELGIANEETVLLVGGAGLGAKDINNLVITSAPTLLKEVPNLKILHISGGAHELEVKHKYKEILGESGAKRVKVLGFSPEFYKYLTVADLVITRAGATTMAELAMLKKASILIPAPFLTGGHQIRNAKEYEENGSAVVLANDVQPEDFQRTVASLLQNPRRRGELSVNIGRYAKPEAAGNLAGIIIGAGRNET